MRMTEERAKIVTVIVLLCVAALVAYARFGCRRAVSDRPPASAAAPGAAANVAPIDDIALLPPPDPTNEPSAAMDRPVRDIFAPPAPPAPPPAQAMAVTGAAAAVDVAPPREPVIRLQGITGGARGRVALIDGHVLGVGDRIGRFTVLTIGSDSVTLREDAGAERVLSPPPEVEPQP